jgi:hypothetical protein
MTCAAFGGCRVESGFPGCGLGLVNLRAGFEQELAETPVSMKGGRVELVIEGRSGFTVSEKVADRAHIAIVSTPLHQRDSLRVLGAGGVTLGKVFEDEVGASGGDLIEHEGHSIEGIGVSW